MFLSSETHLTWCSFSEWGWRSTCRTRPRAARSWSRSPMSWRCTSIWFSLIFAFLCSIQCGHEYLWPFQSLKVRPFYEKRMGQEVEADTLGDEFKVRTITIPPEWLKSFNFKFYHVEIFRDMFSASPEAMTSRASPWSRCPTLPKTTLCQFLAALSLFCILIEIILILFYLLYVSGYPDQRQGEVAIEEGNHLLPPPQGCKFLIIVLRSSCADLTIFIFRESARGSPSADASSTATSPSSPWPSSRRERLRWFSRWKNGISQCWDWGDSFIDGACVKVNQSHGSDFPLWSDPWTDRQHDPSQAGTQARQQDQVCVHDMPLNIRMCWLWPSCNSGYV